MMNPGGGGVWWANMPLPPGWDAKYDSNAKKYFYIHHSTRSTQWVDPRKAYYEQQRGGGGLAPGPSPRMPHQTSPRMPQQNFQRMPQQNFQRMPHQSSPRMPMVHRAGPAIPMQVIAKPKCRTCKTNEVPSANQECQGCQLKARQREAELVRAREEAEAERKKRENQMRIEKEQERRRVQSAARSRSPVTPGFGETSFSSEPQELTQGQKRAMIMNLDEAFPSVEKSVVEMVLESSSWDSSKATSVLMTMGPKIDKKKSVAAATATAAEARSATSKQKMLDHLAKMFPSASKTLVELALETTQYNQAKATQVLRMTMAEENKSKKTDTKAKTTAPTTTSASVAISTGSGSSGVAATTSAASSQPKTSVSSASDSGVASTSTVPASQTQTSAPTIVTFSGTVSKPSPPSSAASTASGTRSVTPSSLPSTPTASRQPSTPTASRQPKQAARTKGAGRRARSAERPPKQEFLSQFSSATQGPDASLVRGPDKMNLLDNYIVLTGSNPGLVHGPRKENVAGPSSHEGRHPSLALGPQSSHCTGAQASLAKGSMHVANRQM